ncbi:unnamed protein product [Kluyveromyces dobzhanskii CBS 2104]|uniref:WGS project CCBQ000000000 data, contig 00058 n=1 Tax=Kluyveromyces dobzhanskii CBS 2104 TaxID=1427455 RepID=A0A0A8LCY7_9SACH|nr:unnamed protein product [Kluyveromyces dobzhanskii CBS 2104]
MSRAQEIKEKNALLAKFQNGFSSSTSKVLSWVDNFNTTTDQAKAENNESKQEFFQLPVIQIGSGLSFDKSQMGDTADIRTIGEFIKSDKKVNSLAKKKRANKDVQQRNSIHRVKKDDSQAMVSLKNKIRNQERMKIRNELPRAGSAPKVNDGSRIQAKSTTSHSDSSSDDEDMDPKIQKHSKKQFGLLFAGKKSKR